MFEFDWWQRLEPQWKKAFAETLFHHTNKPTQEELVLIYNAQALRFSGPEAPYPNMTFELSNLSGIIDLPCLEILIVAHHKISSVEELKVITKLKSLFLYNNEITSLKGIENLQNLEQLYVHCNRIDSLRPVEKLLNLKEVYVNDNRISSLEGLTEKHSDSLTVFYCMPNELLKQKEVLRVERELGIRCKGG